MRTVLLAAVVALAVAGQAHADPVKRAEAAEALAQQGKFKEAVDEAKAALAEAEAAKDDLAIAQASGTLGGALAGLGDLSGSEVLLKRAWDIRQAKLGPDDVLTLKALNDYATLLMIVGREPEAEPLMARAADLMEARATTETEKLDAAEVRGTYAMILMGRGGWESGEAQMLRALDRLSSHEDIKGVQILSFNTMLTSTYVSWGRYEDALKRGEMTLALRQKLQGADHPHLVGIYYILGQARLYLGDEAGAEAAYRRGLLVTEKDGAKAGPFLAQALIGLGNFYFATGRPELALPLYQRVIEDYAGGNDITWRVADAYRLAAMCLVGTGRTREAAPYAEKAIEVYAKALGPKNERVGVAYLALARIQYALDRNAEGEDAAKKGLALFQGDLTAENPRIADAYSLLADGAERRGDRRAAIELRGKAVALAEAMPEHSPGLMFARADLAEALLQEGQDTARAYRVARLAAAPMRERAIAKARLLGRSGAPNLTDQERDVFLTAVRAAWAQDAAGSGPR